MASAGTIFKVASLNLFKGMATHVGLCTADPGSDGDPLAEVQTSDWPSYARQAIDPATAWSSDVVISTGEREIENIVQFNFPQQDGSGNVALSYIAFYDAAVGGSMVARAAMAQPKVITSGDGVAISPGGLRVRSV